MDVHVPQAITDQLRRRGVDVLTAVEDGRRDLSDEDILERARALNRVVFTQDIRFRALTEDWLRQGRPFGGLAFGHPLQGTIGQYVRDLELLAQTCDPAERANTIEYLPF